MVQYARVGGEGPFSTMFQQEPLADDAMLVRKTWFDACKDHTRRGYEGVRMTRGDPQVVRVLSLDPSVDNFYGIIVADVMVSRDLFRCVVLEVKQMRAGLREIFAEVERIAVQHDIDYFLFEGSLGFHKWYFEDPTYFKYKERFKTIVHKTSVNKNDALYGVQSLAFDFEERHISLPYGDSEGKHMTDVFAKEVLNYPFYSTDDMMMALWFLKFNYRRLKPREAPHARTMRRAGKAWSWWAEEKRQQPIRDAYRKRRVNA
jgi:hypothetical protein